VFCVDTFSSGGLECLGALGPDRQRCHCWLAEFSLSRLWYSRTCAFRMRSLCEEDSLPFAGAGALTDWSFLLSIASSRSWIEFRDACSECSCWVCDQRGWREWWGCCLRAVSCACWVDKSELCCATLARRDAIVFAVSSACAWLASLLFL
jgi:hypothetical protein